MTKLDTIAEFMEALQSKDVAKARKILDKINVLVGPHFRYEEEILYPTLRVFLGEYVDQLLKEHDGVIATARSCAELLKKDSLTGEEAKQAVSAARALLIHVSNCDGLSILSERLNKKEIDTLSEKLATARKAGVPLLDWSETIRGK